ncbi:hypothetical protein Dsin_009011 [Dipteronia sinensis]|uniref:Uncharacterized protein n=1 Tax=Dipteronia sinensis TaxID=43782 RepID=A0AAE0APS6_9ROSI|nr:hypothetical protein Dsin_009011 [Dipteronia sinensis]
MDVKLCAGESFIWQSLLWGRDLLREGTRKRVGYGSTVSIYEDRWNPWPTTFIVVSPQKRDDLVLVSQLKIALGGWDGPLILDNFVGVDVGAILSIPTGNA